LLAVSAADTLNNTIKNHLRTWFVDMLVEFPKDSEDASLLAQVGVALKGLGKHDKYSTRGIDSNEDRKPEQEEEGLTKTKEQKEAQSIFSKRKEE
jgi:hypothetical protein